jgi:hypothetical protein
LDESSTRPATSSSALTTSIAEQRYRNIAIIVVMLGVTMTGIDTSAVVLSLPVMMVDLRSDLISIVWVIMAYLLVITCSVHKWGG